MFSLFFLSFFLSFCLSVCLSFFLSFFLYFPVRSLYLVWTMWRRRSDHQVDLNRYTQLLFVCVCVCFELARD